MWGLRDRQISPLVKGTIMELAVKAKCAAFALVGAIVWSDAGAAADLGGGSLKDRGWSSGSAVGPCYLRADVGRAWSQAPDSQFAGNFEPGMASQALKDVWFAEAGVGCGSGSRGLRGDVTFGIRESADFRGDYIAPGPVPGELRADITTYTTMFNGYYDLGNMNGMVPYVGAGIGFAYHHMGNVTSDVVPGALPGDDKVSFAWALMAGFGYQLTDRAILDVGYRYIDMGSAQSSNFGGTRLEVDDMRAHEIKIGLRYHLGSSPVPLK
jgi:opacity protein-like surface antigen